MKTVNHLFRDFNRSKSDEKKRIWACRVAESLQERLGLANMRLSVFEVGVWVRSDCRSGPGHPFKDTRMSPITVSSTHYTLPFTAIRLLGCVMGTFAYSVHLTVETRTRRLGSTLCLLHAGYGSKRSTGYHGGWLQGTIDPCWKADPLLDAACWLLVAPGSIVLLLAV